MKQTSQTKSKTEQVPRDLRRANSKGLLAECDDAIYTEEERLEIGLYQWKKCWKVLLTKVGSHRATVVFKFETEVQAKIAAWRIAKAIGGQYFLSDPRQANIDDWLTYYSLFSTFV